MYNKEILNKLIDTFGIDESTKFCNIVATMYDIKYNASKELNPLSEYDFERDWWNNAYKNLKKEITI